MQMSDGYKHIDVKLMNPEALRNTDWKARIFDALKTTWHDMRDVEFDMDDDQQHDFVQDAFEGRALPTVLESIQLQFMVTGISRACSHQLVRGRVGWWYNQESQMPQSIADHVITIPKHMTFDAELAAEIEDLIAHSERVYRLAVEKGIPYQSARYVALEGCNTAVYVGCSYPALRGACNTRLCLSTNDEIGIVFRKMVREVEAVSPFLAGYLTQPCDRTKKCSLKDPVFPCCGKYKQETPTRGIFTNAQNNAHVELHRMVELQMYNDGVIVDNVHSAQVRAGRRPETY